jgi:peptide/nickel transport system substrate-binding protein
MVDRVPASSYRYPKARLVSRIIARTGAGEEQPSMRHPFILTAVASVAMGMAGPAPAEAKTLRYATQEEADALDPAQGGTYGGRVIFAALCDKLVDITPELEIAPMLATSWEVAPDGKAVTFRLREGVVFHDGTPFDAAAVKYNIERAQTLPTSRRKGELAPVERVEVVDPSTVRLVLSQPSSPLLATLTDRAGMMISPTAAEAAGDDFATAPVCSGPYSFVERRPQESITLRKFDRHWNASAFNFDEVVYSYVEDPSLRLAQLRAGDIDIAERVAATDLGTVRADPDLQLLSVVGLGVSHLHINLNNGERADTVLGNDPRVREAFELAIDREVINQVAFDGENLPGNQMVPPTSPYYVEAFPIPARNVARARELLQEAGHDRVPVALSVPNDSVSIRVGEIIQSLAGEAGFDVEVLALERATSTERYFGGNFQMHLGNWSGRSDPDGNLYPFLACDGGQNFAQYCSPEVDAALKAARAEPGFEGRYAAYEKAASGYLADRPTIPIYHPKWLFAARKDVTGITLYPDALLRLEAVDIGS